MAPIRVQKMILFLLQKGTKSFYLILGGIFVASMQCAASVRNMCKYIAHMQCVTIVSLIYNKWTKLNKARFITADKHFLIVLHCSLFYSTSLKIW